MSPAAAILPGCDVLPPMTPTAPPTPRTAAGGRTAKAAGRFKVLNTFLDFTLRHLSRAEAGVWLVLYRDTKDGIAQTSQGDMAKRIGSTPRHVRRALDRLETLGLLTVVRRGRLGQGASRYRVRPLIRDPAP